MAASKIPNMTDYEAECRNFSLEVPEYFNFATDVVGKWAQDPRKLAILWVDLNNEVEQITFTQIAERSSRAANAFASAGIAKGERVLLMLQRIPEWWEAVLGLFKLGAIPIPCTTLLTPKDLQFRAEIAEPVAIITDSEGAAKFDQVREQSPTIRVAVLAEHTFAGVERQGWSNFQTMLRTASPEFTGAKTRSDDPCLIYFTSGTVGYPKMVLHTHARIHHYRERSSRRQVESTRMTSASFQYVVHSN